MVVKDDRLCMSFKTVTQKSADLVTRRRVEGEPCPCQTQQLSGGWDLSPGAIGYGYVASNLGDVPPAIEVCHKIGYVPP